MSNVNETSNLVTLSDSELDAVSGGMGLGPMWFQVQAMQQMGDNSGVEKAVNIMLGLITPPSAP